MFETGRAGPLHAAKRPRSGASRARRVLPSLLLLLLAGALAADADARTREFCDAEPWYGGKQIDCGGHLQPACTSGAACDSGHNRYSGDPFPKTIDCPTIRDDFTGIVLYDVPDETVRSGCYDWMPTCNDCGGAGEAACPEAAEPWCEAGCDDGLKNLQGLCVTREAGDRCTQDADCASGMCERYGGFSVCVPPAGAGESCLARACADGLQCTLALECAHEPARLGETCDAGAPCADGLYCAPGVPQRCRAYRKVGEGCSPANPCVAGASCEACLTESCKAPFQCFPDASMGAITTQQCKTMYSPGDSAFARRRGDTLTYATGNGISAAVSESQAFGSAYGHDGRYGCFTTFCYGVEVDAAIEYFVTIGVYDSFDAVGGASFVNNQDLQIPGSLINANFGQVYERFGDLESGFTTGELLGTEWGYGPGLGANPAPFTAGSTLCETTLDLVYDPTGAGAAPPPAASEASLPPPPQAPAGGYGVLELDGVDDGLAVRDGASLGALALTGALTVEAWIRPDAPDQTALLVGRRGELELGLEAGELVVRLANADPGWGSPVATGAVPRPHRWTHVALVHDGGELRLHVDGVEAFARPAAGELGDALPDDDALYLGVAPGGTRAFSGRLDAVRLWARALGATELRGGLDRPVDPAAPGLLAAWPFAEPTGDRLADRAGRVDLSLASLGAGAAPVRRPDDRHVLGGALAFDGVDDRVAVSDPAALAGLEMDGALTLEAWVHPTAATDGLAMILAKEGEYWLARHPDGRLVYALKNASPGWVAVSTSAVVPEGAWSHVALVYDPAAGEARVYLDGEPADIRAASGALGDHHPQQDALWIGARMLNGGGGHFAGVIDEVRVWRVARTAAQIGEAHDAVVSPDAAGLAGYWRFDEGPLGLAFDAGPGARHGSLGGGLPWLAPERVEAAGLPVYPRALLTRACAAPPCDPDADADGVPDHRDNCLLAANESQLDTDRDGYGNACDGDFNNDGFVNSLDLGTFRGVFFTDDADGDLNGDGFVNSLDLGLFRGLFFAPPGPSSFNP